MASTTDRQVGHHAVPAFLPEPAQQLPLGFLPVRRGLDQRLPAGFGELDRFSCATAFAGHLQIALRNERPQIARDGGAIHHQFARNRANPQGPSASQVTRMTNCVERKPIGARI